MSRSRLAPVVRRSRRFTLGLLALGLGLALVLPGCSKRRYSSPVAPVAPQGVSADYIAPVVRTLDFSRFVLGVVSYDWDTRDHLDASWTYGAGDGVWRRHDLSYQTEYVAAAGGPTVEIRDQTEVTLEARFSRRGVIQQDLMTADHASLDLSVRQRRYPVTPGAPLDQRYDVVTHFATEFSLIDGSPGAMRAPGSIEGWWVDAVKSGGRQVSYLGTAELRFDFPDHFVVCPLEQMTADIRLLDNGEELDRFSGTFGAGAGESEFTGALASARGPARFAIDSDRGCPADGTPATAPGALRIRALR
jgi:hypothetical protein